MSKVSLRQKTKVVDRSRCHKALEKADGSNVGTIKDFTWIKIYDFYLDLIQTECMLPVI
jgi:hypothetical protein